MSTEPKSGSPVTFDSINNLQEDAGSRINNIELDHISRGTFGPEHMVDSVIFTARDFSSEASTLICGTGGESGMEGDLAVVHPMTVNGGSWGDDVSGPDFVAEWAGQYITNTTRDYNDSVIMQKSRRHWQLVDCASSKTYASTARSLLSTATEPFTLDRITSSDWTDGSVSFVGYKAKFGNDLFKIGNNGRSFALLFNNNFEIKYSTSFLTAGDGGWDLAGKNRWRQWEGGCRVWTSVIYFLKPNPDAPFVLKWSPRHMIGCSAASYQTDTRGPLSGTSSEGVKTLQSPMINEVHSYQDLIQVNQTMVDSLCMMSGKDPAVGMNLDGDASFGWATMAGIDRWDGLKPHAVRVDMVTEGDDSPEGGGLGLDPDLGSIPVGFYTYTHGQPVIIDNGNCSFVAFNYEAPSSDRNISLYNNFIGK